MSRLLDFAWAISFGHRSEEAGPGKGSHTPISSLLAFLVQGWNWWERTWMRLSLYESNYFLCSVSLSKPQMLFHVIQHWNRAPLNYSKIYWYSCHFPTEKILGSKIITNSLGIVDGFSSYYIVVKIKMREFHVLLPGWGQNTNKNNKNLKKKKGKCSHQQRWVILK